jgi:hypothetical protein
LFNGKPQATVHDFASACGSPLNENDQYATQQTDRQTIYPLASAGVSG